MKQDLQGNYYHAWEKCLVHPNDSILKVLEAIESAMTQLALVVDEKRKLIGTVTDGDIRRALLINQDLQTPIKQIMNKNPLTLGEGLCPQEIKLFMIKKDIQQVPIINLCGQIVHLYRLKELVECPHNPYPVVIMSGGLGSRLRPLTENSPKPLLNVGPKPILESLIETFSRQGFRKLFLAVRYKAHMIKEYFDHGEKWNVNIKYIEESQSLGTAGALKLPVFQPSTPFIVCNGDILTQLNFESLISYHKQQNAIASICTKEYSHQLPYGIVETENCSISRLIEKPIKKYLISTGIYLLNPECLEYIPSNIPFDMPQLFASLLQKGLKTATFPFREYWIDIGQKSDYEKANQEYERHFGMFKEKKRMSKIKP